jgi:hypothetical protein
MGLQRGECSIHRHEPPSRVRWQPDEVRYEGSAHGLVWFGLVLFGTWLGCFLGGTFHEET